MSFRIKKRGKLTYYYEDEFPQFSCLVTEEQADGDLKIYFAGLAGGHSVKRIMGLEELAFMDPEKEIPLVFQCWEMWLKKAGICDSLQQIDFLEIHAFGCQPKTPNPLVDPVGYGEEQARLRQAYAQTYRNYFKEYLPENGVPVRFTVYLNDVPDGAASYEFYSVGLFQRELQD